MISSVKLPFYAVMAALLFAPPGAGADTRIRETTPNIILITIDTVRSDHVGCYGATNAKTATLDGLARDGILFERAIAQVPLTYPSHAVIMTGLYPFQNGAQDFTSPPLDPSFRTLAQALHDHGYTTGAVVSSFALDHSWGLGRGFDFYDDAFSKESYKERELGLVERKAEESVTHALRWLQTNSRKPFFLWLHLYDPHSPYDPPEPFWSNFSSRPYDGEIAYADQQLGRLIRWLKQAGLYNQALIVAASDHGESLGDHGEKEHGFFVYDSTVRVPLILKPPAAMGFKPKREQSLVETAAIAATILKIAGVSDSLSKQAASAIDTGKTSNEAYSETFYPFNSFGWSPLHSLHSGHFHFIEAPTAELYDLATDPNEKNNLADSEQATVAVLRQRLKAVLQRQTLHQAPGNQSQLNPEAQQKLQALGYFSYRSPVPQTTLMGSLDDPKLKLAEFNELLEAQDALHSGDFARGTTILTSVRAKDPQMYIVPFYLGEAALAQQDWEKASTEFKDCVALSPQFEPAMTGLARALALSGKNDEAMAWAKKALTINPRSYQALYELGFLDSAKDRQSAISYYEQAIAIQPNYAPLQRDLGLLQLQERDFAASAKHLEKAVTLGVDEASVWNALGIVYGRTGRPTKAIEAYKKALVHSPETAEIHFNLAAAYRRLHQPRQARAERDAACKLNTRYCQ